MLSKSAGWWIIFRGLRWTRMNADSYQSLRILFSFSVSFMNFRFNTPFWVHIASGSYILKQIVSVKIDLRNSSEKPPILRHPFDSYRKNFVALNVYFKALNYEIISQEPEYPVSIQYISIRIAFHNFRATTSSELCITALLYPKCLIFFTLLVRVSAYYFHTNVWATSHYTFECSRERSKVYVVTWFEHSSGA